MDELFVRPLEFKQNNSMPRFRDAASLLSQVKFLGFSFMVFISMSLV